MRILVPSIIDPAIHRGGAGTVTRAFMQLLQRSPLNADIDYAFPASTRRRFHRARQIASIARTIVSRLPSKALLTHSRRFVNDVRKIIRERTPDLVMINGSDLLWLLPELPEQIPRILIAHNIEHRLFQSQIDSLYPGAGLRRNALMRDCRTLREYETSGIRTVHNVIFLSKYDADFGLAESPRINALTVPPIFEGPPARRRPSSKSGCLQIGFVGNFGWWPNRDGLRWFLEKVFPYTEGDTRLHLFGEETGTFAAGNPRIVDHGFVPTTQDIWPKCDFMICPIHSGGGVNVKFAEAVYSRMPVLATSFAARGLALDQDAGIVVLDSADEWVSFLRSDAATELGARCVPESIANSFAMDPQVERVRTFVEKVILARL